MHQDGPVSSPAWLDAGAIRSIADRVAVGMARRIVTGELGAGAWLTEVEVANELGVSRTPVREALLRLQVWGLVRIAPKKGAVVTVPTARERRDLLAVRAMMERDVVGRIVDDDTARSGLSERLSASIDRQRAALEDPAAFAEEDYAFHAAIIRFDDNAVVTEILALLGPRLARLTTLAVDAMAGRLPVLADEHAHLAEAVAVGDPARFAALIDQHLASGHSGYRVAP